MKKFHFSASQKQAFDLCPRFWAFQKIDGLSTPTRPAAQLGSDAHLVRERWLLTGEDPPNTQAGRLARKGLHLLPEPGSCDVEVKVNLATAVGDCSGRVDFFIADQEKAGYDPKKLEALPPTSWSEWPSVKGIPLVGDHKTTANRRWMKTETQLSGGDPQALIYAKYALETTGAPAVDLLWAYMVKSARFDPSDFVRVRLTREEVEKKFSGLVEEVRPMLTFFDTNGIKARDVPVNERGCTAYGGCPFLGICDRGRKDEGEEKKNEEEFFSEISALAKEGPSPLLQLHLEEGRDMVVSPPDSPANRPKSGFPYPAAIRKTETF